MQSNRRKYGIMAIAGCTMLICAISGMGANCKGIYYEHIAAAFQVSLSEATFVSTLYGIVAALTMPVSCMIYRKVPSKAFLPAMVFLYCLSNYMMGCADNLTEIYIWGALQGLPGGFIVFFPVQYIIGNWFPDKKGSVLGLVLMSTGVAGMIFNPVAAGWIQDQGWQWAYRTQSVIILLTALPAALFLLYKNPEEVGFSQDASSGSTKAAVDRDQAMPERTGMTTVLKLFLMVVLICGSYGLIQHLPKYASDAEKTVTFGALLVSMSMAGNLVFKLVLGWINDKLGAKVTTLVSAVSFATGMLLVISGNVNAIMLAGAFFMGSSMAMISLQIPLLFRKYCDTVTYEKVYPITCSINVWLCAASQTIISVMYQWLGGYRGVFIIFVLLMAALCCVLLSLGRKMKA